MLRWSIFNPTSILSRLIWCWVNNIMEVANSLQSLSAITTMLVPTQNYNINWSVEAYQEAKELQANKTDPIRNNSYGPKVPKAVQQICDGLWFGRPCSWYNHTSIQCMQCDNGGEFVKTALHEFFLSCGITYRLSSPYTSSQNGKAEHAIHTTNDILRTLLIQASMPLQYWVEALHTATYLLNRRPCKPLQLETPYQILFHQPPQYTHLRVFGCLCYPNLLPTTPHKLAPRSTPCVFLGYSAEHKGYRCLDLKTHRIILSRHVTFDEQQFPFAHLTVAATPATADRMTPT